MVTDFLKVNGVNLNDLHSPTIRCPFNVNALMIFCPAMVINTTKILALVSIIEKHDSGLETRLK